MIEVEMNDDIRKFETKFMGSFTKRQTICAGIGIVIGIIVAFIASKLFGVEDMTTKFMVGAIAAMPLFMCGWGKMRGLPFELYVGKMIYRIYLTPCIRKYKSVTYREELKKIRKKEETDKFNKMTPKERKQYQKKKISYSQKKEYRIYR